MDFLVKILVKYKEGILNPEAKVIKTSANQLGYDIGNFSCGKYFSYETKKQTRECARREAKELSNKLLSNPIIEDFKIISIKENE